MMAKRVSHIKPQAQMSVGASERIQAVALCAAGVCMQGDMLGT
jgi:hypothetical protein